MLRQIGQSIKKISLYAKPNGLAGKCNNTPIPVPSGGGQVRARGQDRSSGRGRGSPRRDCRRDQDGVGMEHDWGEVRIRGHRQLSRRNVNSARKRPILVVEFKLAQQSEKAGEKPDVRTR